MNSALSLPNTSGMPTFFDSVIARYNRYRRTQSHELGFVHTKVEDILNMDGQLKGNEVLLLSPESGTTAQYLSRLTNQGKDTLSLAIKVVKQAGIITGNDNDIRCFVNLFPHDFSEEFIRTVPKNGKKTVLEVVETGKLGRKNTEIIQELTRGGYEIAIDDYPLGDSPHNHSRDNLRTLLDIGISPIVKVDGRDVQRLIDSGELRELEQHLKGLQAETGGITIAEWVRNSDLPILRNLEIKNLWVQGRELRAHPIAH